jgi:hypothetical protein
VVIMVMPPPTHDSFYARWLRKVHPGWGWCLRCGLPWPKTEAHTPHYVDPETGWASRGCFPLCEDCWQRLGHPEARIPYYGALIEHWEESKGHPIDPEERRAIGRAVANEPNLPVLDLDT